MISGGFLVGGIAGGTINTVDKASKGETEHLQDAFVDGFFLGSAVGTGAGFAAGVVTSSTVAVSSASNVANVVRAVSLPSSSLLRKNMINEGYTEPEYKHAAHHIVAGTAEAASEVRGILIKYGVNINDAVNGVFLPSIRCVDTAMYHCDLHTGVYYSAVNELLRSASSRNEVIEILGYIRNELLNGTFPR